MKNRRTFTKEYKVEAVRLAEQRGVSTASRQLGVDENLIYRWRQVLSSEGAEAFRGRGNRTALEEENRRLTLELQRTREELEILKKAAAYFAKHQR
jgi:transposase